ncbi:MAG: HAMP domain-containing histidine kinase, partial [Actinomycetota bacterium]|nr:HAMP domain-containing histidine kinase [Actinomycetota bacterium]
MRRRLLAAILATVTLSLVLSGTGTYLLLRRQASQASEAGIRAETEVIAALLTGVSGVRPGLVRQRKVREGLSIQGIAVVLVGPRGVIRGELPQGVTTGDLDPQQLLAGRTESGSRDGQVWAVTGVPAGSGAVGIVLTRSTHAPRPPLGWFLVAGGLALLVGAAVAAWLSDSLTRPLRQAQEATVRIAAGDLTSPLPEPAPTSDDEVAALTRSINAMAASLAHARGLERQFLLSVSHDLRTPLTSIKGYAEAITDGAAPDPVAAARVVRSEAQRLERLVQDLLDLARLDAREFSFHLRPVGLREIVADTVEGFRPAADAAGIAVHVVGDSRSPGDAGASADASAMADPDRFAQAVANLVENALKFATANVWVDLSAGTDGVGTPGSSAVGDSQTGTREAPGHWLVSVADDGPGIEPSEISHIFDRLYVTGRRPARQVGGTGLGLAIVREL